MENREARRVKIGYLPFYVDYYEGICPDFPMEKAAVARRCAERLSDFGQVVWDGKLIRDVNSAAETGGALKEKRPDCVVVLTTIAVFGGIPWAALRPLRLPILIWNAQGIERVGEGYSMVEIVRNTGQIGAQALANTLLREGRSFRVVTGYERSEETRCQLESYFRVIRTVKAIRRAKLLAIGETFPLMTDISVDDGELERRIGPTVLRVTNEELTQRYLEMDEGEVDEGRRRMRDEFAVEDLSEDEAGRSVRLSLAFDSFVDSSQAHAGTLNCHAGVCLRNPAIGITACYALGRQNAQGRPFTCTGDLPTAIAMLLLKVLTGVAMYTEVQVMDEEREAVVIANSGEGEDGIRRKGCPAAVRGNTNFSGTHGRGASFAYPLRPGPATMVSFTPTRTSFRLIVAEGEIMEEPLPDAGALAGFFRFAHTDLLTGYRQWLEAGVVHHAATSPGHWNEEIGRVAELIDVELISI